MGSCQSQRKGLWAVEQARWCRLLHRSILRDVPAWEVCKVKSACKSCPPLRRFKWRGATQPVFLAAELPKSCHHPLRLLDLAARARDAEPRFQDLPKLCLRLPQFKLPGTTRAVLSAAELPKSCHHPLRLLDLAARARDAEPRFQALRKLCLPLPQFKLREATLAAFSAEELLTSFHHPLRLEAWATLVLGAGRRFRDLLHRLFPRLQA